MRSHDAEKVAVIAAKVYQLVFADGSPRPHILLRDYARGVVERALWLGADIDVNEKLIRPPYQTTWPSIPSEDEIAPYLKDYWSIRGSVFGGDFGRYVIGTNWGMTNWLSLSLDDPPWRSPESRIKDLLAPLPKIAQDAWTRFTESESAWASAEITGLLVEIEIEVNEQNGDSDAAPEDTPKLSAASNAMESALAQFLGVLTPDQKVEVDVILRDRAQGGGEVPPRFDLSRIQRYVLKRVVELGWTLDKFAYFDERLSSSTRGASKAERIGKKYQWIAYHEIVAFVADHYQYEMRYGYDQGDQTYQGPWQDHFRDIDPSITLLSKPGDDHDLVHKTSWWVSEPYTAWLPNIPALEWIKKKDDIPNVKELLISRCPNTDISWINLHGFANWRQPHPADEDWWGDTRRAFWLIFTAYFVRSENANTFMEWANNVNFMGRWMPDPPDIHGMFVGEYGWSPAYRTYSQPYYGVQDWEIPSHNCPVSVRVASLDCSCKPSELDCSTDSSLSLSLVHYEFLKKMKLRWTGSNADFVDQGSELAVFDPSAHEDGPSEYSCVMT